MTYMQNGIVTEMRDGELIPVPLKAGAVVLVGTFALVDDTGFAVASTAAIAATQKVMGVWDSSADNTDGESGDVLACVRRKNNSCSAIQQLMPLRRLNLVKTFLWKITKPSLKQQVLVFRLLANLWVLIRNLLTAFGWRFNLWLLLNKMVLVF